MRVSTLSRALAPLRALALVAATLLAGLNASTASAGALATLASSMPAGSWAELTSMSGWDGGNVLVPLDLGCNTNDYITQYAEKAAWDPVNDRVLFVGQTHGTCYGGRFVIYSESSNTWTKGPWPSGVCQSGTSSSPCFSHAYDHNTTDPRNGDMYFRQAFTMKFFRFRNGSWSSIPAPATGSSQCCGALEFFPDMDRLIFMDGDWGVWSYNPGTNAWTALANTNTANAVPGLPNLPMISYNNFALYNPVQKALLFGGGSNVYKMASNGTITKMRAPPVSLGVTSAVISVDPVSGKYIVLAGSAAYQYDLAADTWQQISTTIPATLQALGGVGDGLVQAPITEHGVIMYIKYNNSGSKVYLYKHSPTAAMKTPQPPSDVSAN
jgi:hypothetical protein